MFKGRDYEKFGKLLLDPVANEIGEEEAKLILEVLGTSELKTNILQQIKNVLLVAKIEYSDEIAKIRKSIKDERRIRIDYFQDRLNSLNKETKTKAEAIFSIYQVIEKGEYKKSRGYKIFEDRHHYHFLLENKIVKEGFFKTKIIKEVTKKDIEELLKNKYNLTRSKIKTQLEILGITDFE